ncbi:MAG: N-6 DNA methylase [Anaerolineaceae bacterium]|nr:N-6 DNA methylase [Anaerolineaceae bacterium]
MSLAEKLRKEEVVLSGVARQKRLGQYFTGVALGRLLAALSGAENASSVIDPMAGSGDILAACVELGAIENYLGAIEIDPVALELCTTRLPRINYVLGDAFNPNSLNQLPRLQWNLVITNPPYVRYQSMANGIENGLNLPNTTDIRDGLLKVLDIIPFVDETDRALFKNLAFGYSGLADLAVPAWILCAALVAHEGTLALVVPDAWLSRDYSALVRYMLLRWFKIKFIVEDEHASWFSDAQVKTSLLVAQRIPRKESAFTYESNETFLRVRLSSAAKGSTSIVEGIFPSQKDKERRFAQQIHTWLASGTSHKDELIDVEHVQFAQVAENLYGICNNQKWFPSMQDIDSKVVNIVISPIPNELIHWLETGTGDFSLPSLERLGVHIGQGLRTGANAFFYVDILSEAENMALIVPSNILGLGALEVPLSCLLPALRSQAELSDGYAIDAKNLKGRVLALQNFALFEDIEKNGDLAKNAYSVMPGQLAALVKAALNANFGTQEHPKHILAFTAVQPNIRVSDPKKGVAPRFWYMLPDFAPRHRPDLFMARINGARPKTFLNIGRNSLIDANFSTFWLDARTALDVYNILALLNSSWCCAALELSASIMGGGALKVEATHLRRLPMPNLDAIQYKNLSYLGNRLANSTKESEGKNIIEQIDYVVASALLGRSASRSDIKTLEDLVTDGITRRGKHNRKVEK